MKTIKKVSKIKYIALFILLVIPTLLFSQQKINGKSVKSGIWKGAAVKFISGEIAINLTDTASATQLGTIFNKYNVKLKQRFDNNGWSWITLPDTIDVMTVISELQKNSAVKIAEPNFVTQTHSLPNDPYFNGTSPATYAYQWALKNTGQNPPNGTVGADIDASDAWNITTGSSNVIIGILDTGIPMQNGALSHPDLNDANRIILGPDETGGSNGVQDLYGHGTHVTGIAAAETNNGAGIAGIDWNSKILVVKVFDDYGYGYAQWFYDGVIYAVNYVQNNPGYKLVINYSGGQTAPSSVIESAVSYANTHNVTIVASAGNNNGGAVCYPAAYSSSYPNVIAVSATDQNDVVASYSNVGSQIIVSAPGGWGTDIVNNIYYFNDANVLGKNIFSTEPNYAFNLQSGTDCTQNYGYLAGTSMAAPQVTGTIGLMLSLNSDLTPSQIRQILKNSANKVSGMNGQNFTNQYGYGRLNANKALLMTLANSNISLTYDASGDNHNRTLARGYYLYETFSSGGEILVRQSTDNGTSWNYTNLISSGNGSNTMPSIVAYTVTGSTDTVNVVWQRSLGNNYYDVYYAVSGNSGAIWSNPVKIASNVLVSSNQYGGPQPVIAGIACQNPGLIQAASSGISPMLPPSYYYHGVLVVYTSNSGPYSINHYFKDGISVWSTPTGITTSAPGSYVWYPSLASYGGSTSTSVLLSYDARYYHKIYSKLYTPSTDSWSSEAIVYDGTSQSSYDRYSCISVDYYVYAAWNSYNSSTGYYSVKFRLGNVSNVWSNWQWTYSSTTANLYNPSITGYNSGANVAISEFTSPGNQILLHKANVSTQTWTTYTVGSNAQYPNLPNINYDSGTATPVEVWTGTIVNNAYPLSISSQDFSKLSVASAENSNLTIYKRAVTSDNLRIELGNISAFTSDGQKTNIPLKSFDYTKQADLSKPWQYFETDNSSSISNVSSVSFDLSINSSSVDSLKQISKTSSYTLSPAELEIYNGEQLVYSRAITSKDTIVNQTIEFNLPNGVISCLRPVIKFSGKDTAISFTTIENTISETSAQANKYASTTSLPSDYTLNQNYPNPFNPSTIISYDLPKSGHVILKVYDILGREVSTLFNGNQNAGSYSFSFNASKLASGVYFYQIRVDGGTNNFISTKKMQILK